MQIASDTKDVVMKVAVATGLPLGPNQEDEILVTALRIKGPPQPIKKEAGRFNLP